MAYDSEYTSSDEFFTVTQRYCILTTVIIAGVIYYSRNDLLGYARSIRPGNWPARARHGVANQLERAAAFLRGGKTERVPEATALAHDNKRASSRPNFQLVSEYEPTLSPAAANATDDILASSKVNSAPCQPSPFPLPLTRSPSPSPSPPATPLASVHSQTSISLESVRSISLAAVKCTDEEVNNHEESTGDSEHGWAVAFTKTAVKKAAKAAKAAAESSRVESEGAGNNAQEDAVRPGTTVTAHKTITRKNGATSLPTTPNPFAALDVSSIKPLEKRGKGKLNRRKKQQKTIKCY